MKKDVENTIRKDMLRVYLLMKISAENDVTILGKKRLIREWKGYAGSFGLPDHADENACRAFFTSYIGMCKNDKTYASTLFGMMPAKDENLMKMIKNELLLTTYGFPKKLGLEAMFAPLSRAALAAYEAAEAD